LCQAARCSPVSKADRPETGDLVAAPARGDGWLHEIKHDGYRPVRFNDVGSVVLRTRGNYDWTERFPAIVLELQKLKAKQAILDSELCAMRALRQRLFQKLTMAGLEAILRSRLMGRGSNSKSAERMEEANRE
jgi:ATP-dependent DNA ligase